MGIDAKIETHTIQGIEHTIAVIKASGILPKDEWPRFLKGTMASSSGSLPSNYLIDSLTSNDMIGLAAFREVVRMFIDAARPPIYIALATNDLLDTHRATVLAGEAKDSGLDLDIQVFSSVKKAEKWLFSRLKEQTLA